MSKIEVKNVEGKAAGEVELSDSVFGITPNIPVPGYTRNCGWLNISLLAFTNMAPHSAVPVSSPKPRKA